MQITPVRSVHLAASGASTMPLAAPPAAPDPAPVERTPAWDLYTKVGTDILRMPGVRSMRLWGAGRPTELGIVAVDERAAAAISAVLEPVLDGVKLQVYVADSQEPYAGPAGRVVDQISLIDALAGIWNHKASFLRRGNGTVTFHATSQSVIDRLDPILRDRWHRGVDANGWAIWVNVRWKVVVPTQ